MGVVVIVVLVFSGVGWAKALYPYNARNPKEISIQVSSALKGQLCTVVFGNEGYNACQEKLGMAEHEIRCVFRKRPKF